MNDPYPIKPFSGIPNERRVELPGSKSITNRVLLLAALCKSEVCIRGVLFSRDTRIMLNALQCLGISTEVDEAAFTIKLSGGGGGFPRAEAEIDVGNAGTVARFLPAALCLQRGGRYVLRGDEEMQERPIKPLLDALEQWGAAKIEYLGESGFYPFRMHTLGLKGGTIGVDASASSQLLSSLLLAGPMAANPSRIELLGQTVSRPFVAMTIEMMRGFGARVVERAGSDGRTIYDVEPTGYDWHEGVYQVEPDATAASYFGILPFLLGGSIYLRAMQERSLQGDIAFFEMLARRGMTIHFGECGLRVMRPESVRVDVLDENFNAFSDTFLTLAAVAPVLPFRTRISGIAHTRKQETDRVAGMARELKKLVGESGVIEGHDSLEIIPDREGLVERARKYAGRNERIRIGCYNDHRFAMSFGILGSYDLLGDGNSWIEIENPQCCGKTFPRFFDVLENLRNEVN